MRIVDRKTFLAMPSGTVFSKYEPCAFGDLRIKGDPCGDNDFWEQEIVDAIRSRDSDEFFDLLERARTEGVELDMDFHCESRDGRFEERELYAVWSLYDVRGLIHRLQESIVAGAVA